MEFASLFSGIEGFGLGLERSGMRCIAQVEKDASCRSVLARHFPDVQRFDDVREFNAGSIAVRPDLICGGFPCQDLSVAGKRAGLAGSRSGLWFEFKRCVADLLPQIVLIENVPGLLSSGRGRDFGIVVKGLADLGYGVGWRVLDAQWFGLAQRRKRVFVVGCLGNVRRAAEILFERESLPWDSPPSREARTRVAASLTSGTATGSGVNKPGRRREDDANLAYGGNDTRGPIDIATACNAKGGSGRYDFESDLTSCEGGTHADSKPHVAYSGGVRRLTPRECERLQGFPDDWTRYGHDGKELSDSARYRMLGNAVAVPVAQWIGRRIMESQKGL